MPGQTKTKEAAAEDVSMVDASEPEQGASGNDATMTDGAPFPNMEAEEQGSEEEDGLDAEFEDQRVRILPGSIDSAASFEFIDEGHTLGNALRHIIMKNPNVEFCAYAIPHPSEPKMNLRIQTYEGTAVKALRKGLVDLQDVCDVIADTFWTSREAFCAENVTS